MFLLFSGDEPRYKGRRRCQFNLDHADRELKYFGQELVELAEAEASGFEAAADLWRAPRFLPTFSPTEGDRALPKAAPAFATSATQTHAAKLDQFLIPKLRRLNYL